MNILVIGSGGREHAIAWKLASSPKCGDLYIAPGNAGTASIGKNVDVSVNDFEAIQEFIDKANIGLVIVGPEDPLANGITDHLSAVFSSERLLIIGPGRKGANLESSKDFAKNFMNRHNIPTAKAATFDAGRLAEGLSYLETNASSPYVLKANGLAAGKGVVICEDLAEAKLTLRSMLEDRQFGEASSKVLIEEHLSGIELSVFVLTDGNSYLVLPAAKDYKRIGEGDTGPNTGGMGAISPVAFASKTFMDKVENDIIRPTVDGLKHDGIPYCGFIFIGLMNVNGDPYVIEYNVRMGDPETQAVLPRIKSDFLQHLVATASGTLANEQIKFSDQRAATVVMASGGYPGAYEKGHVIPGLDQNHNALVFHAGTKRNNGDIITNGGRVLTVTGLHESPQEALDLAYDTLAKISWSGCTYRKDIGQDLLAIPD